MENQEEILDALNLYEKKPTKEIPPLLEDFLRQVAKTGETLFPWTRLKKLFINKLDQAMVQFNEDFPFDHLQPYPNVENCKFEDLRSRVLEAIDRFHGAPFTVQRICELVTEPRKHYKRTDKFLRGIEKNVLVVSTVDPFGRKIVSEPPRAMMNGLDVNGFNGSKVEDNRVTEGQPYSEPVKPNQSVNWSNNNATAWPAPRATEDIGVLPVTVDIPAQSAGIGLFRDETLPNKLSPSTAAGVATETENVDASSDEARVENSQAVDTDRLSDSLVLCQSEPTEEQSKAVNQSTDSTHIHLHVGSAEQPQSTTVTKEQLSDGTSQSLLQSANELSQSLVTETVSDGTCSSSSQPEADVSPQVVPAGSEKTQNVSTGEPVQETSSAADKSTEGQEDDTTAVTDTSEAVPENVPVEEQSVSDTTAELREEVTSKNTADPVTESSSIISTENNQPTTTSLNNVHTDQALQTVDQSDFISDKEKKVEASSHMDDGSQCDSATDQSRINTDTSGCVQTVGEQNTSSSSDDAVSGTTTDSDTARISESMEVDNEKSVQEGNTGSEDSRVSTTEENTSAEEPMDQE